IVGRVDRVPAVAAADRDHVDRRLALLQGVDLARRGLRPEDVAFVEEEGRARRARRMPRVEGELVEVVLRGLHLAVFADLVAQAEERVLDLAPRLRDRVEVPERELVAGPGDVDDILGEGTVELGSLELGAAPFERFLQPVAEGVENHAALAVADGAQALGELAPAAEEADAGALELGEVLGPRDRALGLGFEGFRIHAATVPSPSLSFYDSIAE